MNHLLRGLAAAVIAFAFLFTSFGDNKSYAKPGKEETLAAEGLKIKLFKDVVSRPLPTPNSLTLHNSKGDKFEACNPWDVWTRDQYVASWGCAQGTILIFKMTLPVPSDLPIAFKGLSIKKDYDTWKSEAKPDWNENSIKEWLKYFSQNKFSGTTDAVQKDIPKKNKILRYHYADKTEDIYDSAYLVECTDRPGERFLIAYELARDVDVEKSEKAILSSLQSLSFFPPKKAEDKQSTSIKTTLKKDASPEFAASRESVIKSIKNLKGWEYIPTDNFIIGYNVKNKKTISELQSNLEKSRSAFTKFYPLKNPLKAVSVCKVFETREEYVAYVPEQMSWTSGVWMPMKRELAISPLNWGTQADSRKVMIDIAYHEGFHQYIFYAADEIECAVWFNEGNATFFEGIDFKAGDKVKIDTTEYLKEMKRISELDLNLDKFIKLPHSGFYSGNRKQNYTVAWGLMFYLLKGAPSLKEKNNYSDIPYKYYDALLELKNGEKATEKAWEGVDMKKFARDFEEFWKSDTMIRRAESYDPVAERAKLVPKTPPASAPAGR
ncbi:MAG TPA: hypothetical protein DCZ94_10040 [Lentisphaeria bacterium]|nr:MAG: hypothetical protein A2X48_08450 [Lentisphaerae bacterium GWF2_49_21]HBC87284.1 hypothetical protein [Lentisphaeria bacterium]